MIYWGGELQLMNTLFADNWGPAEVDGPDIYGDVVSLDYNLIETTGGYTLAGATDHDIIGVDPNLAPLADNGGPTATHALRFPSPAIDAISVDVNDCTDGCTDQRRYLRAGGPGAGRAKNRGGLRSPEPRR